MLATRHILKDQLQRDILPRKQYFFVQDILKDLILTTLRSQLLMKTKYITSSQVEEFLWVSRTNDTSLSDEINALANGPNRIAQRYKGFSINGFKFYTQSYDINKKTQNNGVVNTTEVENFDFYGKINDIIDLNYSDLFHVVLFKCDWVNTNTTGIKKDQFGYTSVNFSHLIRTGEKFEHDPFVFSSQVEPVFYIQDPKNINWNVVVKVKPRDVFDMNITSNRAIDYNITM